MHDEDSNMREAYHSELASTAKAINSALIHVPHGLPAALVYLVCSYVVPEPVLVHGFGFVTDLSEHYMDGSGDVTGRPRLYIGYGSFPGFLTPPLRPESGPSCGVGVGVGGSGGGGDGVSGGGGGGGGGGGDGGDDDEGDVDEYGMTGQERHQKQIYVGHTICRVLKLHGLAVDWSGDACKAIICRGFLDRNLFWPV